MPADWLERPPFTSVKQAVDEAKPVDLMLATTKAEAKLCQFLQKALPGKKPMTAAKLATNLLKVTAELSAALVTHAQQTGSVALKWEKAVWGPLAAIVMNVIEVLVLFCLLLVHLCLHFALVACLSDLLLDVWEGRQAKQHKLIRNLCTVDLVEIPFVSIELLSCETRGQ